MKSFMQKLLINYALAIIGVAAINGAVYGPSEFMGFSLELLLVMFVVRLAMLLTDKFESRWPALEKLVDLGAALAIVLGGGWLFGWYDISTFGYILAVVVAVYVAVYAVGIGRAKREAESINEQIKLRRIKRGKNDESC